MTTDTRRRLIDAAVRRFYREGFRNVGIDAILTDVGISKTAFYKHFASKDALMLAVLELKHEWLADTFRQWILEHGGPTAVGQIRSLFDLVETFVANDEFHGCIFVNVAMEFPLSHDPAHEAAARNKRTIEAFVTNLAQRAGALDPAGLAKELCLLMEGAYVTHQVTGDREAVAIARRVADLVIAARLPAQRVPVEAS